MQAAYIQQLKSEWLGKLNREGDYVLEHEDNPKHFYESEQLNKHSEHAEHTICVGYLLLHN